MDKQYAELFKIPKGVIHWLKGIENNVVPLEPEDIFGFYTPMDKGNTKLSRSIFSFSLLPISTCGGYCKGCYDIRAFRYLVVRKKRYLNYSLAVHNPEVLEDLIVNQVVKSRTCKYVRIHVGGDFFSLAYVEMWGRIVKRIHLVKPSIKFYTYTKTMYTKILKEFGINVVKSLYENGQMNFGSLEDMKVLAKEHNGVICPVTLMNHAGKDVPNHYCGRKCFRCMKKSAVFFVNH